MPIPKILAFTLGYWFDESSSKNLSTITCNRNEDSWNGFREWSNRLKNIYLQLDFL